ncbi:hypothetical protein [Hymenobacter perfusus]|uniref:Uncharacterized protein n=1 Tax=Hymenobacter perfusus TaxID=1236770 RepID=A0A3R9NVB7_9BACT|nr:hypothetical protein [Hymenobacter perfusus]RSK38410.1 hypothetical protein EI293_21570 [Hymenobacter perfusus]
MTSCYTLTWFKEELAPRFAGFAVVYRSCGEGDFGTLERVEFESDALLGTLDFWSHDWLDVHVIDRVSVEERLNLFLGPDQETDKAQAIAALLGLL